MHFHVVSNSILDTVLLHKKSYKETRVRTRKNSIQPKPRDLVKGVQQRDPATGEEIYYLLFYNLCRG